MIDSLSLSCDFHRCLLSQCVWVLSRRLCWQLVPTSTGNRYPVHGAVSLCVADVHEASKTEPPHPPPLTSFLLNCPAFHLIPLIPFFLLAPLLYSSPLLFSPLHSPLSLLPLRPHFTRLAKQPDIAVSVDLLVVLLADEDSAIRKAAMEVYLRRVYRAHSIKTLTISDNDGIISAEWAFTNRSGVRALSLF